MLCKEVYFRFMPRIFLPRIKEVFYIQVTEPEKMFGHLSLYPSTTHINLTQNPAQNLTQSFRRNRVHSPASNYQRNRVEAYNRDSPAPKHLRDRVETRIASEMVLRIEGFTLFKYLPHLV